MLAGAAGDTSGLGALCPRLTLAMHAELARDDHTPRPSGLDPQNRQLWPLVRLRTDLVNGPVSR
jgi:hypothetical protein